MEMLRISHHTDVLVDVLLAEGEWDAAIRIADGEKGWGYSLVKKPLITGACAPTMI